MDIGLGAARTGIVGQDSFPEAGSLSESDTSRDDGTEYFLFEEFTEVGLDLPGQVGPIVVHGQENTFDGETWIEGLFDAVDGIDELRYALEGKEFALNRDEDRIGGDEGVECEEIECWRAIDQDVLVLGPNGSESLFKAFFARFGVDEIEVGGNEVLVGGKKG